MDWLIDPTTEVYILIVIGVGVLGYVWTRHPSRSNSILLGVGVLIAIGWVLSDVLFESLREQAVRKMRTMADASERGSLDDVFVQVSPQFLYRDRLTKFELRTLAERAIANIQWDGFSVWDFERQKVEKLDDDTVRIGFLVKANGFPAFFYCETIFGRDPDGELRLRSFLCFDPMRQDQSDPVSVPRIG